MGPEETPRKGMRKGHRKGKETSRCFWQLRQLGLVEGSEPAL